MTTAYDSTFPTPFGEFSLAVNPAGAVVAAAFGGRAILRERAGDRPLVRDDERVRIAREQVAEYFAGGRRDFDLPLDPAGTPFQQRVWRALREIPFGETRNYGAIARRLGTSARAVGRANATNPLCLLVPCHRVIGADGSLTGYAFGEDLKRRLLRHEGAGAAR
jgi:methylated-DNA-[protein]-cysteine S-methyltransferase